MDLLTVETIIGTLIIQLIPNLASQINSLQTFYLLKCFVYIPSHQTPVSSLIEISVTKC